MREDAAGRANGSSAQRAGRRARASFLHANAGGFHAAKHPLMLAFAWAFGAHEKRPQKQPKGAELSLVETASCLP